jgi:hypothetical protein
MSAQSKHSSCYGVVHTRDPTEAVMTQLPRALKHIRLKLTCSKEFPSSSDRHGYIV